MTSLPMGGNRAAVAAGVRQAKAHHHHRRHGHGFQGLSDDPTDELYQEDDSLFELLPEHSHCIKVILCLQLGDLHYLCSCQPVSLDK